jgi:hypothetical protein
MKYGEWNPVLWHFPKNFSDAIAISISVYNFPAFPISI